MTDFKAINIDNRYAEISWSTHSETASDYFVVERSSDGENFTPVEKVAGAGNSSTLLKYLAYDQSPAVGINYYRLKQVDFDGKFTYSQIRSLYFKGNSFGIELFPNPTENGSALLIEAAERGEIYIRVSAISGEIVQQITTYQEKGVNSFFVGEGLKPGIYNVLVKCGETAKNLKLVVI